MNKRDNPYTPGAGRKPRTLAGRDQDMEAFQSLVERLDAGAYERSLVYTGLRGVGKTVLLMEFDVLASEAGWATTDVQEVGSSPDFRTTFARMAARLLMNMSRRHRAKQRIERALSVVKAFSIAIPGTVELQLDVEAATGVADSGDPEQDLAGLLREIGEVAQANQMGALFLIDEMQNLDGPALAAICMAFQAISRAGLPVTMVGAGLPDLRVRLLAAKPYADRLFSYAELGRLSESAAWSGARRPGVDGRRRLRREDGTPDRERGGRVPVLPAGVRTGGVELRRDVADRRGRPRRGPSHCEGHARPQLLRHPLRDGHRHGAEVPRRDGLARHRPVPGGRGGEGVRRSRSATGLHAPRFAHRQGAHLEPSAGAGGLHRAALRRVHPGERRIGLSLVPTRAVGPKRRRWASIPGGRTGHHGHVPGPHERWKGVGMESSQEGPDTEAFRAELRAWLQDNLTPEVVEAGGHQIEGESLEVLRAWNRTLADGGWAAPSWPVEHGGRGAGVPEQLAYLEETNRVRAPGPVNVIGVSNIAPAIMQFGTPEQQERFLQPMLRGDEIWSQGMSEPDAGSDLASLRTAAVEDGDDFVINGQKTWNSLGHFADWCQLYVRTDPTAKKHAGITCFLVDLRTPGIEARPLTTITGGQSFAELFFTDARVPRSAMLGPLHAGWSVAMTTLSFERAGVARPASVAGQPARRPAGRPPGEGGPGGPGAAAAPGRHLRGHPLHALPDRAVAVRSGGGRRGRLTGQAVVGPLRSGAGGAGRGPDRPRCARGLRPVGREPAGGAPSLHRRRNDRDQQEHRR